MTTNIEWVRSSDGTMGKTWNPVAGCTRVSPGCQHCYAETMAKRLVAMGQAKYQGTIDKNGRWTGVLNRADDKGFNEPLRNKKPTTYFVNSMSDLFHESMPEQWLIDIWGVMRETPQHTYQILTKRADVMAERVGRLASMGILPNVWLGVSVESQQYADERIPHLLNTPAVVRFLSCEPLLGSVDLGRWLCCPWCGEGQRAIQDDDGTWYHPDRFGGMPCPMPETGRGNAVHNIDWVIVGGESGPQARPMHPEWARAIRDQCQAAGVAFFFKQWGNWIPGSQSADLPDDVKEATSAIKFTEKTLKWIDRQGNFDPEFFPRGGMITNAWADGWDLMNNIGKHAAGRLLDGREWNEMPEVQPAEA